MILFFAKLAALDPSAWTEDEKAAFTASLDELQKTIVTLLSK